MSAAAQAREQSTEIPAQSLRSALDAFSRAAGVNVTYDPALIGGKTSAAASVIDDRQATLQRLLAGTGLEAVFTSAQPRDSAGFADRCGPVTMLGRLFSALTLALGLGSAEAAARPQQVSPERAPAAWTAYAETVTAILSSRLSGEDEAAARMRASLHATAPAAPPLVVKLWIDPDGALSRIDFPPLQNPAADAELRAVLTARGLPPPPPDMLLPLRVALQLQPAPEPGA